MISGGTVLLKVALIMLEYMGAIIDEAKDFGNVLVLLSSFF